MMRVLQHRKHNIWHQYKERRLLLLPQESRCPGETDFVGARYCPFSLGFIANVHDAVAQVGRHEAALSLHSADPPLVVRGQCQRQRRA